MLNNDNNKNNLKYYHTTLFDCKFQAGFEERREQEYRLFSFKTTKQRLKMSMTLLMTAAPICWPPAAKSNCFFFSFHFMKFYLLFSLDHFMFQYLLCFESQFQFQLYVRFWKST